VKRVSGLIASDHPSVFRTVCLGHLVAVDADMILSGARARSVKWKSIVKNEDFSALLPPLKSTWHKLIGTKLKAAQI
jgi:hypothetical protein